MRVLPRCCVCITYKRIGRTAVVRIMFVLIDHVLCAVGAGAAAMLFDAMPCYAIQVRRRLLPESGHLPARNGPA